MMYTKYDESDIYRQKRLLCDAKVTNNPVNPRVVQIRITLNKALFSKEVRKNVVDDSLPVPISISKNMWFSILQNTATIAAYSLGPNAIPNPRTSMLHAVHPDCVFVLTGLVGLDWFPYS